MEAPTQSQRWYRFGLFEIDLSTGSLFRQGIRVRLQEQPFRVLTILLQNAGETVTREELRDKLWPADTNVEFEGSLNSALKRLRFALGDSADNPIFIETVPKRGYRFIAPISADEEPSVMEAMEEPVSSSSLVLERPVSTSPPLGWQGRYWGAAGILVLVFLGLGWRYSLKSKVTVANVPRVIAVLPFTNNGAGANLDYLRYSIANELVTDLTHARSISVRPFASTSRYASQTVDPVAAGRELRVTHILTGDFLLDKQNLRVNMELVDVARNELIWRDELAVSLQQLVQLDTQLATRTAQGLLPSMNIPGVLFGVHAPQNERAFTLYSRSLGISYDPGPNLTAIKNLEEVAALDSEYAPAWEELAWRYYIDYEYGDGGESSLAKARQAQARVLQLDPNGLGNTITLRAEQGQLNDAYDEAEGLLARRPDSSTAHFEMSFVLRYAGLLNEARRECDAALAIDPGFGPHRSCAYPFILAGDFAQATKYIHLAEGTGYGAMLHMDMDLRTGKTAAAVAESGAVSKAGISFANLIRTFLNHAPATELNKAVADLEADPRSARDSETIYRNAAALSFCGQPEAAIRQLRKAIAGNYCSYPSLDTDPMFDPIRQRPEFAELRQSAIECQQSFIAHRKRFGAAPTLSSERN